MKTLGWIVLILFGSCATCMVIGAGVSKRKDQDRAAKRQDTGRESERDHPPPDPPIDIRAEELAAIYEQNEVAADDRFKGKRVRVTGVVDSIRKDFTDDMIVHLRSRRGILGVPARMDPSTKGEVSRLQKGMTVIVTCECRGATLGAPSLWECSL